MGIFVNILQTMYRFCFLPNKSNSTQKKISYHKTCNTNYQQLKTMYLQRRYHKLNEWRIFCKWCEELPHFVELTGVSKL